MIHQTLVNCRSNKYGKNINDGVKEKAGGCRRCREIQAMKKLMIFLSILFLFAAFIVFKICKLKNIEYNQPEFLSGRKILIVYFSNGGNTKTAAENIRFITGGDIKEIEMKEKYTDNIFEMSKIIRKQMKQGYLPEINNIDISNYDVIFAGSPIWNFSVSLPLKSFLKSNNFENKILIPFFTYSGGAAKTRVIKEIKDITQAENIKKPLFMFENGIFYQKEQIIYWLNNL